MWVEGQVFVGCKNSGGKQSISRDVETKLRVYVGIVELGIRNVV